MSFSPLGCLVTQQLGTQSIFWHLRAHLVNSKAIHEKANPSRGGGAKPWASLRWPGYRKGVLLTHPHRWPDSKVERVQSLVLETVDSLLRCPAERKEEATHEALSKLRPHVEAELEALETLEWLRDLTDEELARRQAFMMLLSVGGHAEGANKPVRERILALLRLEAATYPELKKLTGAGAGTIRNNLSVLINEGQVVAEGEHPKTYRLASSGSKKTPWG